MKKILLILLICTLFGVVIFFGVSRSIKINYLTTKDNLKNVLDNLYNTFDMKDFYFQNTDKFNCDNSSCKDSIFNNIGILSYSELKSYLYNDNPYFVLDNNVIKSIKYMDTIENINNTTSNRVRPALNVRKGIRVSGKGTYEDPWIFEDKFNVTVFYEANGGKLNDKFKILTYNSQFGDLAVPTKTGHTFDGWYLDKALTKLVEYKTIVKNTENFYIYAKYNINKYTIKLKVVNGTSNYNSAVVNYGDSATFNLTPDEKYTFVLSTVSCDKGTKGTILNNVLTISDVTQDDICTVEAKQSYTCSKGELVNDSEKGAVCVINGTKKTRDATRNCKPGRQCYSGRCPENRPCCWTTQICDHYTETYYECDTDWSTYSGSGSTLKCYKEAELK